MQAASLKKRIKVYQYHFNHKFRMDEKFIDLRTMSQNFTHKQIPSLEIAKAIQFIIGSPPVAAATFDPRPLDWVNPTVSQLVGKYHIPSFAWVATEDCVIDTRCNRDIRPEKVNCIEAKYLPAAQQTLCAVKCPKTGKFIIWEGDHTSILLIRQGYTHLPIMYIQADPNDKRDPEVIYEELMKLAATCFKIINGPGRTPIVLYESHMIGVDSNFDFETEVQRIFDECGVVPVRQSNGKKAGELSHMHGAYSVFKLEDEDTGAQGKYLGRSLKFHRKTWPDQPVQGTVMTAMAKIYKAADIEKIHLSKAWEKELGGLLNNLYEGSAQEVYEDMGRQFIAQFNMQPMSLDGMISDGILLTYHKHTGKDTGIKIIMKDWKIK